MAKNISELKVNTQEMIEVLIKKVETACAANQSTYQKFSVQDMTGTSATFLRFDNLFPFQEECPVVGRFLVSTSEFKDRFSYRLEQMEILPDADITAYYPKAEIDEKEAWKQINVFYNKIKDRGLKRLVYAVLMKDAKNFRQKPLTVFGLYTRQCGIMEATLKLLQMAEAAIPVFGLKEDLTYASALLYYMGNIDLTNDCYVNTEEEILIGEGQALLRRIVREETLLRMGEHPVSAEELPQETVTLLLHTVTARYNGIQSAIKESSVLRGLDQMIRKTEENNVSVKNAQPGAVVNGFGRTRFFCI